MITLREVEALIAVADCGSFMRAARRLGTTQGTVSKIIAGMEQKLGVQLVKRTSEGSSLTREGRYVYGHAEEIETLVLQIREIVKRDQEVTVGYMNWFERDRMLREESLEEGRAEERKNTEAERQRADEAERKITELKAELRKYQK